MDESDSTDQVVEAVNERYWPLGSKASLVAMRKSGLRDPGGQSETGLALERKADRLRAAGLESQSGSSTGHRKTCFCRRLATYRPIAYLSSHTHSAAGEVMVLTVAG